jgi:hypothetical protein
MSSRSLRRVLAGFLVTLCLFLVGPVTGEAADFPEIQEAPSLWLQTWQWLTGGTTDAGWILDPNG